MREETFWEEKKIEGDRKHDNNKVKKNPVQPKWCPIDETSRKLGEKKLMGLTRQRKGCRGRRAWSKRNMKVWRKERRRQ